MDSDERSSALLTPRQRNVARGEVDISDRGKRAARARIQERVENSLLDFSLLLDYFTEDMYQELSKPKDGDEFLNKKVPPHALDAAIAFIYLVQANPKQFERYVENGIERATATEGYYARVDCDIDADFKPFEEIEANFDEFGLGPLGPSVGELRALHRAGRLSDEQMAEINEERRETEEEREERHARNLELSQQREETDEE